MPTILGFFTALFVVVWGTRWYLSRTTRDWTATVEQLRTLPARLRTLVPAREQGEPAPVARPEPARVVEMVIEGGRTPSPDPTPVVASVEVEEARPPRPTPTFSAAPPEIVIEASPSPVSVEGAPSPMESAPSEALLVSSPQVEEAEAPADEVGAAWQEVANLAATPPAAATEVQEGEAVAEVVIGFCARCRDKRPVAQPTRTRTKKGKPAIRGQCSVCGAGMFVFTGG